MPEKKALTMDYLSEENFSDFGQVIQNSFEGKIPLLREPFFNHYAALAFLDCEGPVEFGITRFNKRPLIVDKLEQHAKTPEFLYAIDDDFIIPAAPIIVKGSEEWPDLSRIKAFCVKQGDGIIFKRGFWHWAPFPASRQNSSVLVGFKTGTAENDIMIKALDTIFIIAE